MKVLVVDCDYPQYSIEEMRQRDKDLVDCNPAFEKAFRENIVRTKLQPCRCYWQLRMMPWRKVREIVEGGNDIDIVFFDLPGTINNRGVVNILNCMDSVIVPIAADRVILQSSLAFAMKINEWLTTGKSQVKEMYLLWNLVDARERTELYDQYEALFAEYGLITMKNTYP